MKIARWGLMILLAAPAGIVAAQAPQSQAPAPAPQPQSQDPLAAAARHAREQKKDQPKASKVWDNDDISSVTGAVNVVGQAAPPSDNSGNSPADQNAAASGQAGQQNAAAAPAPTNAELTSELNSAKAELESAQKDLDLLQRKFDLDQQMFLSNPNHDSDQETAAMLKNEQTGISEKQQAVADAQKKVDDLQAKLNAAGGAGAKQ